MAYPVYERNIGYISFDTRDMPRWDLQCEESTTGSGKLLRCKNAAMIGQFKCRKHGGYRRHQREAGERRYVVWLLTGCPDYRQLYDIVIKSLWTHVLENSLLDEGQILKFATALLNAIDASAEEPIRPKKLSTPRRKRKPAPRPRKIAHKRRDLVKKRLQYVGGANAQRLKTRNEIAEAEYDQLVEWLHGND